MKTKREERGKPEWGGWGVRQTAWGADGLGGQRAWGADGLGGNWGIHVQEQRPDAGTMAHFRFSAERILTFLTY